MNFVHYITDDFSWGISHILVVFLEESFHKYLILKQIYKMLRITNRFYAKMSVMRNTQDLYRIFSDVEEEVHDVAVPDDIVLAFDAELAGGAACRFGFQFDEVFVFDDLCADEAFLEV